jgi:hypothetical protein
MLSMEEQDQINKIAKNRDQILEEATKKASEQVRRERKADNQDYIAEWFRWVELTGKYLKNKLN